MPRKEEGEFREISLSGSPAGWRVRTSLESRGLDSRSRPGETDRGIRVSVKAVRPGDVLCLGSTWHGKSFMRAAREKRGCKRGDGDKARLARCFPGLPQSPSSLCLTFISGKWLWLGLEDEKS